MWLKKARTNALLAPLAAVIAGEVTDGQVEGSYQGYAVQACPRRGYPMQLGGGADTAPPPPDVNSFEVTLAGVAGASVWRCQSSSGSLLHGIASQVTTGRMLGAFHPGEFKFEGVDVRREAASGAWMGLIGRLGIPAPAVTADDALQQRLIAAGLFDEMTALRWGGHPYLPKVAFTPPGREIAREWLESDALDPTEPLQAALSQRMAELDQKSPGRLMLEVEMGKDRVPSSEQFRELLEAEIRIARINTQANPPRDSGQQA
ncbi:MAG: hypothetical protein E6G56_00755 [Actinobacteria bacterium]|nr:MAG: hypothetical protein E6G56_00755 [Actinomycetota bacterium]